MSEYSVPTQFIDLVAQQKLIRPQLDLAISRVLDHGQYIMGPEVKEFEGQLREFTGAKHALTCANGTDALSLVLMAWGIGQGDAVFVPSFTYVATAEAPAQLGATPFFVDVCEDTFNIDPQSFKQAVIDSRALGLNPAAVIAVDLFGQPADVDAITEIAHAESIKVLVDGAQSFGATSKGRRVGSMGDATTTSFFPAKPLGCYGDGGAVFTQNDDDAELINSIRLHGKGVEKYDNVRIGLNSRLDTLQAAILIEKLKIFPDEIANRNKLATFYSKELCDVFSVPQVLDDHISTWAQFTLVTNSRDEMLRYLAKNSVPAAVYYPRPLSKQSGYHTYPSVSSGTPISHALSAKVFSIPMHPYMSSIQAQNIVSTLSDFNI
jgi:dTDP-4-amino-4,6-dideoxygalactose transaminase